LAGVTICAEIGFEKKRLPAKTVIANLESTLFIFKTLSER
jgi:hypothetical protein